MSKHYQEAAARLKALTLATPGIIEFANALEGEGESPGLIDAAANLLNDQDRATTVAFLIEVRHLHLDAGDTEAAKSMDEVISLLAQEHWDRLA